MFTYGQRAHVDWNWPISREKISKNRLVCKYLIWELQAPSNELLRQQTKIDSEFWQMGSKYFILVGARFGLFGVIKLLWLWL